MEGAIVVLGVSGVSGRIYRCPLGNGTTTTTIGVNGGNSGRTMLVLGSGQWDDGDRTCSFLWLLRCGYDGNHITKEVIKEMNVPSSTSINVGSSADGKLTFTVNSNNFHVLILTNK